MCVLLEYFNGALYINVWVQTIHLSEHFYNFLRPRGLDNRGSTVLYLTENVERARERLSEVRVFEVAKIQNSLIEQLITIRTSKIFSLSPVQCHCDKRPAINS